ncbi:hypothetical protein Hypma_007322 [Hypsizygus marmoreus]|uniref:DUF6589 domain-containing protein n=1 Tax=Hypsizygus marmoreus TaxID=39966 RepID=A0A369KFI4_HYPMA|nr:hypothetical protein Hypma_007322 [Hypsizygus marmoreus]
MLNKYRLSAVSEIPSPVKASTTAQIYSFSPPSAAESPAPSASKTARKRKRAASDSNKENTPLGTDQGPSKRAYTPRKSTQEKLETVFGAISSVSWSLSEFLYHTFRTKDQNGAKIHRSDQHAKYAQNFLQGASTYSAAMVLDEWFRSPDGHPSDNDNMYTTATPYVEIRPVRAALTSFAAQITQAKLLKEAKSAVKPESGLHVSSRKRGEQKMQWADIGAATVSRVSEIIKKHQPLTWELLMAIATSDRQSRTGAEVEQRRPPDMVCTHVISALDFARNNEARLLPLARGLLYFAFSAPADLFAYGSRVGEMPAYSTISRALSDLSAHEADLIRVHASDPNTCGAVQIDNVQNYLLQRDMRIGRENRMNVGIAGIYVELDGAGVDPAAYDLDDKRKRLAENLRAELTPEKVLNLLDQDHIECVGQTHWLGALVNSVPQLAFMKRNVSHRFRTQCARLRIPVHATKVHPMASSGKKETISTELKDALVDFLSQMGSKARQYVRKLVLVGGDGMTYEKVIQLKCYMQFHGDPFESFELLEAALSAWHAEWTDLSRNYETHWDSILSQDPSTLGHSAAQVGRSAPPNLQKVDYYPCAEFMYLVLDVRMLDCWRNHFECSNLFKYFENCATANKLPTFEELEAIALTLYRTFSTTRAHYRALDNKGGTSEWAKNVPLGSLWTPPPKDETSLFGPRPASQPKPRTSKGKGNTHTAPKNDTKGNDAKEKPPFVGDRVLANSIAFMRDAIISREMSYAIAEGDVGRVYEVMKVMLFTFAGSSHSKYTNYLLETICNLEYESGPALRDAILKSMLVNLTGREGSFSAADFIQEFFNRLLEAIVEKKGVEYGAKFIREVVSRNLHHFARIKLDMRNGVGLEK